MVRRNGVSVVWLTVTAWMGFTCVAMAAVLLSVSLKRIGQQFAIGYGLQGMLAPTKEAALALAAVTCGYVGDRTGKRWLLGAAMFLVSGGMLAIAGCGGYGGLLAGILVMGMGLGMLEALASPLVAELHPTAVSTHMNLLHGFYPAGLAAFAVVVGFALDRGVHWQTPFLVAALPAAAVGVLFLAGRYPGSEEEGSRRPPLSVRAILANPTFWSLALAMALAAGAEASLIYWAPSFLQSEYNSSPLVGGWVLTVFGLSMAAGRFGMSVVTRRFPVGQLMVRLAFLGVAVALSLVLVKSLWASVVLLALSGFVCAVFWPSILSVATQRIATGSATLLAMLSTAGIVGFGAMPSAVGALADAQKAGLRGGLALVPVGFLLAGIVLAKGLRATGGESARA